VTQKSPDERYTRVNVYFAHKRPILNDCASLQTPSPARE